MNFGQLQNRYDLSCRSRILRSKASASKDLVVLFLDRKGIAFSSGSACKSGNPEPSHALLAMGLTPAEAHCSVRFSLGAWNTEEEIRYAIEAFSEVLRETRSAVRFVSCR